MTHPGTPNGSGKRNADASVITIEFLVNMSASADVLAMAKVEVDLNTIPEGKNVSSPISNSPYPPCPLKLIEPLSPNPQVIIKWRGKPVFIRHRTADEIAEANKVDVASLRDPQSDDDRVQKPEWLVMLGVLPRWIVRLNLLTRISQVSAPISAVSPLARLVTLVAGSALATVPTTTSPAV